MDNDKIEIIRHGTAHLLAQAVKRLYPQAKLGVGPATDSGFYYDIETSAAISASDLPRIEAEMRLLVAENHPIHRRAVSRAEAVRLFEQTGEELKLELLANIPEEEEISLYEQGEFVDLCRGPHVDSTGELGVFRLLSVAGAYWRGDSGNKMLTRIYGTAFAEERELEAYLSFLQEAQKRDHRKLGKQLELFMFSEEAPGMPFYLPKGQIVRNELENFAREWQQRHDYEEVRTPLMMNQQLWENSGHWEHYHENMYFTEVEDRRFALKPMNCPGHMLLYKNQLRSYRDLPLRMAEFGQVHRHEFSGALNGMLRVRTFCQDDAHLFVTPDQIEEEIKRVIGLIDGMYAVFGFAYSVELSTRPVKSLGSDELWDQAEGALSRVLRELRMEYSLNPGDGAFYGPKIDFHIRDALNRSHQCATIQLDFQMPLKFDLAYVDEENKKRTPVLIHSAAYGSIDRFFGILVEHYAGVFPAWLAPVQVKVLSVADVHSEYARGVVQDLKRAGIRAEGDTRNLKLGYKMREAQLQKVPYIVVAGEKELGDRTVTVRKFGDAQSRSLELEAWKAELKAEIDRRG